MGLPAKLSERQIKFAELLVFNEGRKSPSECAYEAGYKSRPRQAASELRNPKYSPLVVKYIGELKEERLKKYEVNYATHVAELGRIKDAALKKGAWSAAVNAETNRGKAAGLYIDRKIIKTGKLEDLSESELEHKMKQILDDYAQIIDVTPSKSSESSLPKPEESSSDPQK